MSLANLDACHELTFRRAKTRRSTSGPPTRHRSLPPPRHCRMPCTRSRRCRCASSRRPVCAWRRSTTATFASTGGRHATSKAERPRQTPSTKRSTRTSSTIFPGTVSASASGWQLSLPRNMHSITRTWTTRCGVDCTPPSATTRSSTSGSVSARGWRTADSTASSTSTAPAAYRCILISCWPRVGGQPGMPRSPRSRRSPRTPDRPSARWPRRFPLATRGLRPRSSRTSRRCRHDTRATSSS